MGQITPTHKAIHIAKSHKNQPHLSKLVKEYVLPTRQSARNCRQWVTPAKEVRGHLV